MENEKLLVLLLGLARSAGRVVNTTREKGQIKKNKIPYQKTKFTKFEYKEGRLNFAFTTEPIIKEEWNWNFIYRLLENDVQKIKEFPKVVHQISSIFEVNENQAKFWVSRFLNVVIREILDGASEDRVIELTFSFLKDLEGSPKLWTPVIACMH